MGQAAGGRGLEDVDIGSGAGTAGVRKERAQVPGGTSSTASKCLLATVLPQMPLEEFDTSAERLRTTRSTVDGNCGC